MMPITKEQAREELRRRAAIGELGNRMLLSSVDKNALPEPIKGDFDRIRNSVYYNRQLGIPLNEAYNLESELNEHIFGKSVINENPGKLFFQAFTQSLASKPAMMLRGAEVYTPGRALGLDSLLDKSSTFLESLKDKNVEKKLQNVAAGKLWPVGDNRRWWQVEPQYMPEVINTWAVNVADQIPIMLVTLAGRIGGKVLGTKIGIALAGTEALATAGPDPTDVVSAPAIVGISREVMKHLGGAAPMVAMEAGNFMDSASELQIDPDISEKYARYYGLGSGTIEYAQNLWILGRYSKLTKEAQETILRQVLTHIGGSLFEGVEELSQQGLQNWLIAKAVDDMKARHPDYKGEAPKITEGLKRSGIIGAGVASITGLPGTGMSIGKGALARRAEIKPETKKFLGEPSVQEIQKAQEAPQKPSEPTKAEIPPTTPVEPTSPVTEAKKPSEAVVTEKPTEIEEVKPLTTEEKSTLDQLEAETAEPYIMERVKGKGFVIKEEATGKEVQLIKKRGPAKQRLAELNEKGRPIKGTRRKPKLLTAKDTVQKVVAEYKALTAGLKKAAQSARVAYSIGRREGIEQVKDYYRELRDREKARKELKRRMNQAVRAIKSDIPKSVDYFYREAIDIIRSEIDPSFRKETTLNARDKLRDFIQRQPERATEIPQKLLDMLKKKPLNQYTVEELETLAGQIENLKKQGKLKRDLTIKRETEQREKKIEAMMENVTKGEKITQKQVVVGKGETTKEKTLKPFLWTWRPQRIFDWLDLRKNFKGAVHQTFYDQINSAEAKKWSKIDQRRAKAHAKMKELNISIWKLSESRMVDGIKLTVDQMIGIYNFSKNELSKLALLSADYFGENTPFTEENIKHIIDNLKPNEKAWGDYMIQDFEENYGRLRQSVIEQENRDMGVEKNYMPMRRVEVTYTPTNQEITNEILHRNSLRNAYAAHGFSIKRQNISEEFQKPIRLEATNLWIEETAKQEFYMNVGPVVRELHRILNDTTFSEALKPRGGTELVKWMRSYVDTVANPNIYRTFHWLENKSRWLRKNTAVAYLAYNMVTMAKQLPSVMLYLQDAGPAHLMQSAIDFAKDPMKMIKEVKERDPLVRHRAIERELEEIRQEVSGTYAIVKQRIGEYGMEGVYFFDLIARTIGWNAVYQRNIQNGMSEQEAVQEARNVTLRTQPAAAAKDLPMLYRSSEYLNFFTMFTNQLNQIFNMATYDIPSYVQNQKYAEAALSSVALGIVAMFIWMISNRKLPKEPEDLVEAGTEQFINAIPLFGKSIMAGRKGWESELPVFEAAKVVGRTGAKLSTLDMEFSEYEIKQLAEVIALATGTPYTQPERVYRAAKEQEPQLLFGGRTPTKKKGKYVP